jgi:hypothetical protein
MGSARTASQATGRSSSAHHAARGGARGGRAAGTAVGRPRCVRIRAMRVACSISASSRSRPPHRAHARTSYQARLREALRRGPRDGRPQRVPARPFQACPIARGHDQPGMQVEARPVRVTRAAHRRDGRRRQLGRRPAPAHLGARPRTEREPLLHRRRHQPGQHGFPCGPRGVAVRLARLLQDTPAHQQPPHPPPDRGQHVVHVVVRRWRRGMQAQRAGPSLREHPVQYEGVSGW